MLPINLQEAIDIERETHVFELEQQKRAEEKRSRNTLPRRDEILTREEREARIWAFMSVLLSPLISFLIIASFLI